MVFPESLDGRRPLKAEVTQSAKRATEQGHRAVSLPSGLCDAQWCARGVCPAVGGYNDDGCAVRSSADVRVGRRVSVVRQRRSPRGVRRRPGRGPAVALSGHPAAAGRAIGVARRRARLGVPAGPVAVVARGAGAVRAGGGRGAGGGPVRAWPGVRGGVRSAVARPSNQALHLTGGASSVSGTA